MNITKIAQAMMNQAVATKRNVTFEDVIGGAFFWRKAPMIAVQKDGLFSLLLTDIVASDLSASDATEQLSALLANTRHDGPPKAQARLDNLLAERGWN